MSRLPIQTIYYAQYFYIGNPVNHFPIYEPSAERVAAIAEAHSEANNPLGVHYDASAEVRAKGAGFYQFSTDEETRKNQMEELKSAREETERTRKDVGAVDLKPGEVEGMREDMHGNGTGKAGKSRAMEKRKRELEERRRMIDTKRRKVKAGINEEEGRLTATVPTSEVTEGQEFQAAVPNFEAFPVAMSASTSADPFAAMEAHARSVNAKGKRKEKNVNDPQHAADHFLAQLEEEMLGDKRK